MLLHSASSSAVFTSLLVVSSYSQLLVGSHDFIELGRIAPTIGVMLMTESPPPLLDLISGGSLVKVENLKRRSDHFGVLYVE